MVEIKQQLVPLAKRGATYGTGNPKLKMVVHQTGNTAKGANAQMHANLQSRGYSASWHIQSDDKEVIQSWPFDYKLWHASTGNAPNGGNMVGIGWEICINEDGNYLKSLEIAAKGIAKVMKQECIPMSQLTTHNAEDPKNKWCPAQILSGKEGVNWNDFKAMVQKAYNGQPVGSSKPSTPSAPKPVPKPVPVEKIERKYAEKGTFIPNQTIDVYDKPSTNGKKLVQYRSGESVTYHTVHIGNGNVWIQYTRAGGKGEGYLPIRSYLNGKYGPVKGKLL